MIEGLIVSKLSADATLAGCAPGGVWADVAPRGTSFPLVLIVPVGPGVDTTGQAGTRLVTRYGFQVKAVTKGGSFALAATIAARIDVILVAITRSDGVLSIVRQSRLKYVETDGDVRYNHLGGIYTVTAEADV